MRGDSEGNDEDFFWNRDTNDGAGVAAVMADEEGDGESYFTHPDGDGVPWNIDGDDSLPAGNGDGP